jgi:hypothetical protein
MNLTDLKVALKSVIQTGRTPHLIGHAGTGKSHWTAQYGQEAGYENVIDLRIGQISDVAELQGLPYTLNGVMVYSKPWWMAAQGKTLIILDEVNRATKDVIQGIFQLVYDKRIGQHKLVDTDIIALSNPPTDSYVVLDFDDEAFKDRFVHIKFEPTLEEFKDYLKAKHGKSDLIDFLSVQPELITSRNADDFNLDFVTPSNRSTDYFISLEKENLPLHIIRELSYGVIGITATIAYFSFKEQQSKIRVSGDEVIADYKAAKKRIKQIEKSRAGEPIDDVYYLLCQEVTGFITKRSREDLMLTESETSNIEAFVKDLTPELLLSFATANILNVSFYDTEGREPFHGINATVNRLAKPIVEEIDKAYKAGKTIDDVVKKVDLKIEEEAQGQTNA